MVQLLCDGAERAHMRSSITVWTNPHSERQFSTFHRVINPPNQVDNRVTDRRAAHTAPLILKISNLSFRLPYNAPSSSHMPGGGGTAE